ncbi:MAG TPA: acetolactate synthase small subunit [Bacteroidia bacterium]|jgi:acetolactate synthase-1/3 small subunit|nr:acetolactate synthase small subunit [Bacteroidia bacterium]
MKNRTHLYTLSIFTEDRIGLLNRVTIIFTRRHINIESITASESEVSGIYRYTIVVNTTAEVVDKLVKQIDKQVEVFKAFCHQESEIISREVALYKVSSTALNENGLFSAIVNEHHAKILSISADFIVVEKTGDALEIKWLFRALERFGVLEFAGSGRIAMTKPMKTLTTYLKEIENENNSTIKHFNKN